MKKMVLIASAVVLMTLTAASVFAGGDKNRGDKGQGAVAQVQVRDSDQCTPPR